MRRHKSTNHFVEGVSNTRCDRTSFKRKTNEVQREWTGAMVIPEAFNTRNPQDFPYVPKTEPVFPDARSEEKSESGVSSFTVI